MAHCAIYILLKLIAHEPEKQDMYHVSLTMKTPAFLLFYPFRTE